jgi:DNA-binding NarL/FixJ family response regulator
MLSKALNVAFQRHSWHFYAVGNLKRRASATFNRAKAIELNHQGWSNEQIAAELHCTTQSVLRYMHHYLKTDTMWPMSEDSAQTILTKRAQHR